MSQLKFAMGNNGDRIGDICDRNFSELYSALLAFSERWYVDSALGSDTLNDGQSAEKPFKTIQVAVDAASDGDALYMKGTFTEAVTCAKKLSFINAGATWNSCVWMESEAGDTLLTLTGTNCLISGIRFRVPTTGGIAIAMTNADFTRIEDCSFQGRTGSYYGIYIAGSDQIKIRRNTFSYLNTATYGCAILGHSTTSFPTGAEISENVFHSNLRHIKATMRQSFIHDNLFQEIGLKPDNSALTATVKLDVYGEVVGSQFNTVTRNMFQGTYSISGGYKAGTNDNWYGNKSDKVGATGVTSEGTTTTVPA
jgi:parallel beta-helix repeat protein